MKKLISKKLIFINSLLVLASTQVFAAAMEVDVSTLVSIDGTDSRNRPGVDTDSGSYGNIDLGDVNNDGYDDLVIGEPLCNSLKGRIYIKFGSASGLTASLTLDAANFDVVIDGVNSYDYLGKNVAVTDINNDGYEDIISMAGNSRSTTRTSDLYVFLGKAPSSWSSSYSISDYDNKIMSAGSGSSYPSYNFVHKLGTINGDVTADGAIDDQDNYLALCSDTNTKCLLIPYANLLSSGTMESLSSYYVSSTDPHLSITSGNIDGDEDGIDDLVISSPDTTSSDNVTIYFGPLSSSSSVLTGATTPSSYFQAGTVSGDDIVIGDADTSESEFGEFVQTAKIFDSSSDHDDLVIGMSTANNGSYTSAGRIDILSGETITALRDSAASTSGTLIYNDTSSGTYNYSNLDYIRYYGDDNTAQLGVPQNSTVLGDLNGDNVNDLLFGSKNYADGSLYGINYIIYGGNFDSLIDTEITLTSSSDYANKYLMGQTSTDAFSSIVVTGDFNGDGLDDAFIGAQEANSGYGELIYWPGATTDIDGDGFASAQLSGSTYIPYDCNDLDATSYPQTWFIDSDSDGYGSATSTQVSCTQPTGYVSNSDDCDDASSSISPAASEACDSIDNNCDGSVDEGLTTSTTYYLDSDSDGYGDSASAYSGCSVPAGYVANDEDCDDANSAVFPGGPDGYEIGDNGLDDDCDGVTDDADHDGDGAWWHDGDCDDEDPTAYVGATEDTTNGLDENCNGLVDEITVATLTNDDDGDGYSEDSDGDGIVEVGDDCDDSDSNVFPGGPGGFEVGGNNKDDNCDGLVDNNDYDGDGYYWSYVCQYAGRYYNKPTPCANYAMTEVHPGLDCSDVDASIYLGAPEVPANSFDDNCNDVIDESSFAGSTSSTDASAAKGTLPKIGSKGGVKGTDAKPGRHKPTKATISSLRP